MSRPVADPASASALPAVRIVRRCPDCGAVIEHGEDDGAVGCDYCGAHLAIGAGAEAAAYALAAAGGTAPSCRDARAGDAPGRWMAAAKTALRTSGIRVRALESPRALLTPYHRLRARAWQWYRSTPQPEREETGRPHLSPPEGEGRFRLGIWDATTDAAPALGLGPANLGFRTQVLPWTPLADLLHPDETSGPDLAVLPAELDAAAAHTRLADQLAAGWQLPPEEARDQLIVITDPAMQVMYAPLLLCPFLGIEGRAALILDAVNLRAGRLLTGDGLAQLESLELAARDRPPEALPAGALIPLSCPECSSPLPFLAHARVHRCTVCGRHWTVDRSCLTPVPSVALIGSVRRGLTARTVFLPFYRLGGEGSEWFVPAAQGRGARAAWSLALGLARQPRDWQEVDLTYDDVVSRTIARRPALGSNASTSGIRPTAGLRPAADTSPAIDTPPATARALAPFIARCLERAAPAVLRTELVWIAFEPHGPDLVEPGSGLGLPRRAFTRWDRPTAASGGGGQTEAPVRVRSEGPVESLVQVDSTARKGS